MIESTQNDKVKYLQRLMADNRFRKKEKVFVVEGQQENERAMAYGFCPKEFFICESFYQGIVPQGQIHYVSEKLYEKLAYRGGTEGILGIYEVKDTSLEHFCPKDNAVVVVLEGVEKPGNLGAILRSCEAFGIDALIVADAKVDFYNPNVVRSSVGCLFGMQIFQGENSEVKRFLREKGFQICITYMHDTAKLIAEKDFTIKTAVVFGTEHSGISDFWLKDSENILIPMVGSIDSLNLSNAVAICCYEILRQRMG